MLSPTARVSSHRWLGAAPWGCALALTVSAVLSPPAAAQQKEWWDLQAEAIKLIEKEPASNKDLNEARRLLQQALRVNTRQEGKYGTYNPSIREDYLPYFYLGWANLKLGKYDEAEKNFAKSGGMGYITSGAPAKLQTLYKDFSQLVPQLAPAAAALDAAKANGLARQCIDDASSAPGKSMKGAIASIEAILAAPKAENAGGLKQAISTLQSAQSECATQLRGAAIAGLTSQYNAARDAIAVEGVSSLLGQATRTELEAAVKAGNDAAAKGDEDGIKAATKRLQALPSKVTSDVDARLASLARDAEKVLDGNVGALNERDQLGTKLGNLASRTKTTKAAGKSGDDLAVVVGAGRELDASLGQARAALKQILDSKSAALGSSLSGFESWSRASACDVRVVDAVGAVGDAVKGARAAAQGQSADEMDRAAGRLASVRSDVEEKMKAALPRMQEQARSAISGAADLIANIPKASDKQRGESLTSGIEAAVSKKDACAIEEAIGQLNQWVKVVAPELEKKRNAAIARNKPSLDAGEGLIAGFGGILKADTVEALKAPVANLAALVKSSYDEDRIDAAGKALQAVVDRAQGEVKGSMEAGIEALKKMREDPRWTSDVSPGRRSWLEDNLGAVESAVRTTSQPELLARFAKEYPRARLELALVNAFESLYDKDDPAAAARTLEDVGPGIRAGSAALNYTLSYCYWWQGRGASPSDRESLLEKARKAFEDGKALNVDLASLGAPLFAPAFVQEMTAR